MNSSWTPYITLKNPIQFKLFFVIGIQFSILRLVTINSVDGGLPLESRLPDALKDIDR